MNDKFKVLFVQKVDNDEFETESLWCIRKGDNYIIDNIPFVAKRVSLGDTIKVKYDPDEKAYYFDDFVSVSGNTTVRVYFYDEKIIEDTRDVLNGLGCELEAFMARNILAINVPENIDYKPIKKYLDQGEVEGMWQYEESCLAHEY